MGPPSGKLGGSLGDWSQSGTSGAFLIPIYGHRYLPATPSEAGNPVFSVYQMDIICYGLDLPGYLWADFDVPNPFAMPEVQREIEFWGMIERRNSEWIE